MEDPRSLAGPAPGPGAVNTAVVRLLAAGVPLEAIPERISKQSEAHGPFSVQDLRGVLADVAAILQEKRLLPPAEAAFIEGFGAVLAHAALSQETPRLSPQEAAVSLRSDPRVRPTATDLDELKVLAERLLQAYLANDGGAPEVPSPRTSERHNVALQYAVALVRQEEIVETLKNVHRDTLPFQAALTGTDRDRIEDFLLYRNLMGRFETLDSLAGQWERSVVWVENDPESYGQEEFADRLISRDALEDALRLLSPISRQTLDSRIRRLDERFYAATRSASQSIRPSSPWKPQAWWWFRVPSEELESG
jgi:hypothetical protein